MTRRSVRDGSEIAVTIQVPAFTGVGLPEQGGGPLRGGLVLLCRFVAVIGDPAVPHGITMTVHARDGALACESIVISEKPSGPPVTSVTLRSALISLYLQKIRDTLGLHYGGELIMRETARNAAQGTINYSGLMPEEWQDFDHAQLRRAAQLTPERAAAAYREALASPDPEVRRRPTAAAAEKLGASRGHTSRLLTQARLDGIDGLGPGRPARRRGGQQENGAGSGGDE